MALTPREIRKQELMRMPRDKIVALYTSYEGGSPPPAMTTIAMIEAILDHEHPQKLP